MENDPMTGKPATAAAQDKIRTRIWREEAEPDNPFATAAAYCHGYDVYGEMLGNARWVDMLYLLFRGEAPTPQQAALLETLAVALANPGPRDPAVHAAMCGGVGGSPAAACLMAALAVGAGQLSGAREIFQALQLWQQCGTDLASWRQQLTAMPTEPVSAWPAAGHPPGFSPHALRTGRPVRQILQQLAGCGCGAALPWLEQQREALEAAAGLPLAITGVAAAAYHDLEFNAEQAEMLHLLLCLPGAAAHALEQRHYGHKRFPFFAIGFDGQEVPT